MVKVVRYNTICSIPNTMSLSEVNLPTCEPVGDYQVDTTHFVPQCESGAVVLQAGQAGQGVYDFSDGKDTGAEIPSARRHSYTGDLAEASVNFRTSAERARETVDKARVKFEAEQAKSAASSSEISGPAQSQV